MNLTNSYALTRGLLAALGYDMAGGLFAMDGIADATYRHIAADITEARRNVEHYQTELSVGIWRGGSIQPWHENSPENCLKYWEARLAKLEAMA